MEKPYDNHLEQGWELGPPSREWGIYQDLEERSHRKHLATLEQVKTAVGKVIADNKTYRAPTRFTSPRE